MRIMPCVCMVSIGDVLCLEDLLRRHQRLLHAVGWFLDIPKELFYHDAMNDARIAEVCRRNSIELLVLFGSTATGGGDQTSDVDLAVKLHRGAPERKLDLLYELGGLFVDREVDLVILTPDTDPVLLREIFTGGRPLYEERPEMFDDERLRAHKLYFDTEKLRAHRDAFLRRFSESVRHVA